MTRKKDTEKQKFLGLVAARHKGALTILRKALAGRAGVLAASESLGVARSYLYTLAKEWKEFGKVLAGGALTLDEVGQMGGRPPLKHKR